MSNLAVLDLGVIAGYFLVLLGIGYWAARREKNVSADYFLAGRDVGWLAVGASLFASNIGSEHLVGLAGTGAASGLAVGHFEWIACFMLLLLGWLFVPFYLRSGVYTMPEFLERRFNPAARWYFTWVSVIGYVLTKISVTLFAGGVVMRAVTGLDLWTSASLLIVITGLYTLRRAARRDLHGGDAGDRADLRLGRADVHWPECGRWLVGPRVSPAGGLLLDVEALEPP
jgi:solute:Na+ symporter, SSS family